MANTILVEAIDSSFVDQVEELAIYLYLYEFLRNFGIQYKIVK